MVISYLATPALPEESCKSPAKEPPFACNRLALTAAERHRHFDELGPALVAARRGVRELPNGYEFSFPSDPKTFAMIAEWVEQERRCCPFFDFDLRVGRGGGAVSLRVTGRPGTKEFMQAAGAVWISPPASR